jgi:hypothetical protein
MSSIGITCAAAAGPERGLAQAHHRLLADVVERVGEADGGRGLAFACRRRGDRRHQDQLAVLPVFQCLDEFHRYLGLVVAIRFEVVDGDAELFLRHVGDATRLGGLGDFDVGFRGLML